jgi:hypothetical protein
MFMPKGVWFLALRVLLVSALVAVSARLAVAAAPASQPHDNAAAAKTQVAQTYGRIPLSFEANQGQADKTVKFISRGSGYSLFLTDSSAVLALTKQDATNAMPERSAGKGAKPATAHTAKKIDVILMDLAGANRATHVAGMDRLPGTANYFIGNDPAQWHSGVPTFAKVQYAGVYPGIDLLYYGNQQQLEYDFVVAPGASPKPIRLQFVGAKKLDLTADGDLTVTAANGQIAFHKPVVYQVRDGVRQPIDGQFDLLSLNTVGFALGQYDHAKPLVIDPVLSYSTYLGGSLQDLANGIAADSSGNAYVVGTTLSTNFPVTNGAVQPSNGGSADGASNVFVAKLNPAGTALVYSTYLGGSSGDYGYGIAVDGSGDAYVTGFTNSTNFPVTSGAYQTANHSTNTGGRQNAFVTKLNPTGTALMYSTYLGGNFTDWGYGIAVDSMDDAYVVGYTDSSTFPVTAGAYQVVNNANITAGWSNVFVTKLNSTGTALLYSTYLGGTGYGAEGKSIAVDSSGDAYVTGGAASTDFPTTNGAFQTTNYAAVAAGLHAIANSAFVTKLNPTGTALVYSTFLGGSTSDFALGIALDGLGDAYVTGYTFSSDFPVAGSAFQPTNHALANKASAAFVTEVNPLGTGLLYSTFLSGSGQPPLVNSETGTGDSGNGIAVDDLGDAYVTGIAISSNFPTTSGAYQTTNNAPSSYQGLVCICGNAYVTKLSPGGSSLLYSTFLGGSYDDFGYAIALDGVGGAYVAGEASSTNFPTTTGAYQTTYGGGYNDAFIAKLAIGPVSAQVAVPNVVGDTQAAATTAITGVGLVVGTVTQQSSATVASGNVISESPTAGTSVNSGSAVNLVTSTGPAQVAVPNVVGDTQAAATTAITGVGLVLGTVTTQSSSTVASGNVISESPVAGTSVSTGSAVNLVVSTGPAPTPSYTLIANPSSLTIKSGSSASTVITLTPTGGFTGTVNFTCGTLPSDVTCTFMPTSLTVSSSTALTTTLTIGTTGTATAALIKQPAGTVLPTLLAALILLPLGFTRRILRTRKAGSPWLGLLLLAGTCLAAEGLLATAGCGGSSSSTPPGTYSVPITVTSGSTTVPLNLSITIQ